MKLKSLMLLGLALGCGLVAMLGVQQILAGNNAPAEVDTVQVLVAKTDISPGVKLDETMVGFQSWSKETVPQNAVVDAKQFEERALKAYVYQGEVILQAKLGDKGVFGASAAIPEGMRLFSFPVNMTSISSGMVQPGDRVDILVTYNQTKPGQGQIQKTKTVLEFIEVFALDRKRTTDGDDGTKGTKAENMSVLVTPKQAELLFLASKMGQLQTALRNPNDRESLTAGGLDDDAFDGAPTSKGAENDGDPISMARAKEEAREAENPGSFKDYLKNKEAPKTEPAPAADPNAAADKSKNTWTIEIYEGNTKREAKIELPTLPGEATATPATPPETQTSDSKPTANAA